MGDWCLIESDPAVFTELIQRMGVDDVEVEEIWSLDQPLEDLGQVHGLVFLFKYDAELIKASTEAANESPAKYPSPPQSLFFAHQVINNACATQAILSILMNASGLSLGKTLSEFKDFAGELPPDMKGLAISNSETMRAVHNSFARSVPFETDPSLREKDDEDAFHFVAYIPYQGYLYELDGLRKSPVNHGPIQHEKRWIEETAKPVIQKRIEQYTGKEIRFNLMAVIKSHESTIRSQLQMLEKRLADNPSDQSLLFHELQDRLQQEQAKFKRYQQENARRRHNFIPFIFEVLRCLAEKGLLNV